MTTETLPAAPPAPLEPTTPIKPSEAIRLGCLETVPWDGALFGPNNQACAVGAALVGWFGLDGARQNGMGYVLFEDRAGNRQLECDGKCSTGWMGFHPASEIVFHLNDTHHWTRERIADWLAEQGL